MSAAIESALSIRALDAAQAQASRLGQALLRQRPAAFDVALRQLRHRQQSQRVQPQLVVAGPRGTGQAVARRALHAPPSRPCASHACFGARPRRRAGGRRPAASASRSSASRSAACSSRRACRSSVCSRACSSRQRSSAWAGGGAGGVPQQRQRPPHMRQHAVVREALPRLLGRAGMELGRVGRVAGLLEVLGRGAQEVARARLPCSVRPASHCATLAWPSRLSRLSTVS